MNRDHVISDEVLAKVQIALLRDENWMVYNNSLYFIDASNIDFFKTEEEAKEFCESNYNDRDCFNSMHIESPEDLIKQIPYGNALEQHLSSIALQNLQQVNNYSLTNQSFFMNEQNLQYLKDSLKYLGFGDKLYPELEKNIQQGFPEFKLSLATEYNREKISTELYFRKSDTSEMYFFNRYDANLEKTNGEKTNQTFYINKGSGITTKEAYNLLNGRAVFKDLTNSEGQKYNAWIQLDFKNKDEHGNYKSKHFHENYGYDLERAVKQFAIKELEETGSSKILLHSLEKGNLQAVTFEKDNSSSKMFIEANPQFKTINIYDGQMKPAQKEAVDQYRSNVMQQNKNLNGEGVAKEKTEEKKNDLNESKKNSKSIKTTKVDSLLPKKRTSQKKGLSLS